MTVDVRTHTINQHDRTRMTLRNRGMPTAFSKWMAPFMAFAMRRANQKGLAPLKRRLETTSSRNVI
jgi:hypothetical protein